ncbi:hypothetical protein Acr_28g0001080 [Actinidia rufa]|uniref:Mediator of RNA polymerase II transcription subunit 28 n=1 Tax=Actinidia rufa TaxID=165716 RepID=A0A7J0H8H1_9ERIC|nr:hypothetical protein Acr_28g0001080 [Actinidia rufa]
MADRQPMDQQNPLDPQGQPPSPPREDMIACVMALEAALLPCLPARELQAIDRSPCSSHPMSGPALQAQLVAGSIFDGQVMLLVLFVLQLDVEGHAKDFMEAAKKLQLYFTGLQREDKPTRAETLRKEIVLMEEELKIKSELIGKQEGLIKGWRKELKDQLDKHNTELERV